MLLYDGNITGSDLEIFGYLRKYSVIFGNFRKMFGDFCLAYRQLLENLRRTSESDYKMFKQATGTMILLVYVGSIVI